MHGLINSFPIPATVVPENPCSELSWFLGVDTSMADRPRFFEKLRPAQWSVMNVDVVFVGKNKLDQSQRILGAGCLPHR